MSYPCDHRRGEKGKVSVRPSLSYSMQTFARKSTRRNSWDYVRLLNEARKMKEQPPSLTKKTLPSSMLGAMDSGAL